MGIQAKNPHEDDELLETALAGEPIAPADDEDDDVEPVALTAIDHIAIVVEDLGEAIAEHRESFGVLVDHREDLHDEDAEIAFLTVGDSSIALIAPTSEDSAYADFLADGGPGMHHIAYRVDDCAAAMVALAAAGRELLADEPADGPRGSKVAFVHPDSAYGVLVQLVQR